MTCVRNNMVLSDTFLLFRKAKKWKEGKNKSKKKGGVFLAELGDSLTNSVLTGQLLEPFPSHLPVSKKKGAAMNIAVSATSLHDSRGHMTLCKGGSRKESLGMLHARQWIDMPVDFYEHPLSSPRSFHGVQAR